MKKFIKIFIILVMFISFKTTIKAGVLSISASQSIATGTALKVKININNLAGRFKVTSSDNSVLAGSAEDFWESGQTVTFTALKAGTATITVTPIDAADYDSGVAYTTSRSITVNVTGPNKKGNESKTVDVNKNYSTDNDLKSLSVDGYDLTPTFSNDVTEYTLNLDSGVKTINVNAQANDKNATVKGIGEINVSEGTNTIVITVIAENGNEKNYTIYANVEDSKPVNVKIGKKKYTVVKNIESLKIPDNYTETTVMINDVEVPALTNEITGYILVALKDKKGNVNLFIYNPANGKYTKYNELSFDMVKIQYLKPRKVPSNYKGYVVKLGEQEVNVYKKSKRNNYALIYGMNLNNGSINWYSIDLKENTIQRYNMKDLDSLSILNNKFLITIIILSVACLMLMLFMLILMLKIRNHKRS